MNTSLLKDSMLYGFTIVALTIGFLSSVSAEETADRPDATTNAISEEELPEWMQSIAQQKRQQYQPSEEETFEPAQTKEGLGSVERGNQEIRELTERIYQEAVRLKELLSERNIENLSQEDIESLKVARSHLDGQIGNLSNYYLGINSEEPHAAQDSVTPQQNGEDNEDCQITSGEQEATCDGDTYQKVGPTVVGEVEFPEDFEAILSEVPREVTKESLLSESQGPGHTQVISQ